MVSLDKGKIMVANVAKKDKKGNLVDKETRRNLLED